VWENRRYVRTNGERKGKTVVELPAEGKTKRSNKGMKNTDKVCKRLHRR
jgi:hypothetical protein